MKYRFRLCEALDFGWPGIKGRAYSSNADFPRASVALFDVEDRHGRVKNPVSDRIYLVLEGSGEFIIAGEVVEVQATDVVIVPRNTVYDYRGKMKLFLVHAPAYNPETDVDLEGLQSVGSA